MNMIHLRDYNAFVKVRIAWWIW